MTRPPEIFEKEYYDRLAAIESSHWWTLGMTDIMEALLREWLPERTGARILDIGCGSGIGLAWAARRLPRALRLGVDVSPFALGHCQGLGAQLCLGSAAALPCASGTIDLALCLDVLQHLEDEGEALREAARVLRAGGVLYLRTNALSLAPAPAGSHLFTREQLERSLAGAGLEVVRCSRANALGALAADLRPWLRQRAAGRGSEPPASRGAAHPGRSAGGGGGYGRGLRIEPEPSPGPLSALKRACLRAEGRWIRRGGELPFGHSLVCLARKSDRAANP